MIQVQHHGESTNGAAESAALHNLDKYMLGEPLKFAHMLWNKAWNMWSTALERRQFDRWRRPSRGQPASFSTSSTR